MATNSVFLVSSLRGTADATSAAACGLTGLNPRTLIGRNRRPVRQRFSGDVPRRIANGVQAVGVFGDVEVLRRGALAQFAVDQVCVVFLRAAGIPAGAT